MPDLFPESELAKARQQGRDCGRSPTDQVADCPYMHKDRPMRDAWLDGFSDSRRALDPGKPPLSGPDR